MEEQTRVKFSNLRKILYPSLQIRKHQVIEYYIRVAPRLLEFLENRALSLYRFPDGIDREGFYGKDAPKGTPLWVRTFTRFSETAKRSIDYVVCDDVETLVWLANLAALEINIPLSTVNSLQHPDMVFFDVDPEPPAGFQEAMFVANLLREKLDLLGLKSYVKTSGKKGLHVVVPIIRRYSFKQTRAFVHTMGRLLEKESKLIVSEFKRSKDPGTVFVDYLQNTQGRTMICPYSLRANEHATVSTPLEWRDLKKQLKPEQLNIFSVLKAKHNPWGELMELQQTLDFS